MAFLIRSAAALLAASAFAAGASQALAASSSGPPPGAQLAKPLAVPPGQATRYVIPFYTSQTAFSSGRTTTVVTIANNTAVTCSVFLRFQYASQTSDICSIVLSVPSRISVQLCSRPVGDPLAPCTASCPGGGLTFNTGHAYVGSSVSPADCKAIAVDPRIYYTNGTDSNLLGSSQLSMVPLNLPNQGD